MAERRRRTADADRTRAGPRRRSIGTCFTGRMHAGGTARRNVCGGSPAAERSRAAMRRQISTGRASAFRAEFRFWYPRAERREPGQIFSHIRCRKGTEERQKRRKTRRGAVLKAGNGGNAARCCGLRLETAESAATSGVECWKRLKNAATSGVERWKRLKTRRGAADGGRIRRECGRMRRMRCVRCGLGATCRAAMLARGQVWSQVNFRFGIGGGGL